MAHWSSPGAGDVGSYQVSGVPYLATIAATETKTIDLKYVSSEIMVSVTGTATIDFQDSTSGGPTTMSLAAGNYHFRVKTKKIRVSAFGKPVGVCVSLTGIPSSNIPLYDQDDYGSTS